MSPKGSNQWQWASARNLDIYQCRQRGESYAAIARRYGIGRERARQIVAARQRNIDIYNRWIDGEGYDILAARYGVRPTRIYQIIRLLDKDF
jgi:Mor family transcriptional regulator